MTVIKTLPAFSDEEKSRAKILLATQVAMMMGRKFEEGDWSSVYCKAKEIPEQDWSNLHIDVMHKGLGVEHKMLCVYPKRSLLEYAGTTCMHPSATRSIRIPSTDIPPDDAMQSVLRQYKELIELRTNKVIEASSTKKADMRTGWLLWERSLTEFLYFEEQMTAPNPENFFAEWNERGASGARKGSKNLWIYEKDTGTKRYSVTTNAGVKIQPYFDAPPPSSKSLFYFRVQGDLTSSGKILIWIASSMARELAAILGGLDSTVLSRAIFTAAKHYTENQRDAVEGSKLAIPVELSKEAYEKLIEIWGGVSDEHRAQLLLQTLRKSCAI
jgi:hypothetical protein